MANKKRIHEAPIDYGDRPERMSPDVEGKINRGETPLSKNPAFPDIQGGQVPQTFEQLIASKRFKDVVDKVKRYTGQENISGQNALMQLQMAMMRGVQDLFRIQANHKEYLENLAVDLVRKEMGVRPDQLQYDAKLVGMGEIDMEGFSKEGEEPEEEEIEQNFQQQEEDIEDFITAFERFDIEKAKRRFINALFKVHLKKDITCLN